MNRVLVLIAGVAIGAVSVGGVAVATSTSAKQVKACARSNGALSLLSKKGKCAKGSHRVTIAKQGVKGARGAPGAPGGPGAAGPGAQTTAISAATGTVTTGPAVAIKGTGLSVAAGCGQGALTSASVLIIGAGDYTVSGTHDDTTNAADLIMRFNNGVGHPDNTTILPGAPVMYESSSTLATDTSSVTVASISNGSGQLTANLLVDDAGTTFTIALSETLTSTECTSVAQVTPTT
jgi:hypothetical protein